MPRRRLMSRMRFANSRDLSYEGVAQQAHKLALAKAMKGAVKQANANLHRALKPTYFHSVPLELIYKAVESAGLSIPPEEKSCILTGRQGRATWPLTYSGLTVPAHLWITWYKMESSGRYEIIGAIT